jgi:hypothetical protein
MPFFVLFGHHKGRGGVTERLCVLLQKLCVLLHGYVYCCKSYVYCCMAMYIVAKAMFFDDLGYFYLFLWCNQNKMAKDIFHEIVKDSLIAEGWEITHDSYRLMTKLLKDPLSVDLWCRKTHYSNERNGADSSRS